MVKKKKKSLVGEKEKKLPEEKIAVYKIRKYYVIIYNVTCIVKFGPFGI